MSNIPDTLTLPPEYMEEQTRNETKAASLFTFRTDVANTSWRHGVSEPRRDIQIAIEQQGELVTDLVVCDHVSPRLLFSLAPLLINDLCDHRIVLPASAALDDDVVNDVVNAILDCAEKGKPLAMHMHREPIRLIKVHCVLVRFGMQAEADTLLDTLWELMGSKELTLGDILWIWDTFADPVGKRWGSNEYIAPGANVYVQMMAWQIVNMDAEGRLDSDIKNTIELEQEPKHFFDMLKKRLESFGLGREMLVREDMTARRAVFAVPDKRTASEVATPIPAISNSTAEVPAHQQQLPVLQKSTSPSAATDSAEKALLSTLNDNLPSPHHDPPRRLDTVIQKAPKFTSAGFMEATESFRFRTSQRFPFPHEPRKQESADENNTAMAPGRTQSIATTTGSSNADGSFTLSESSQRYTASLARTAENPRSDWIKTPWGMGAANQDAKLSLHSHDSTSRLDPEQQPALGIGTTTRSTPPNFGFTRTTFGPLATSAPPISHQFTGEGLNAPFTNGRSTTGSSFGSVRGPAALNTSASRLNANDAVPIGGSPSMPVVNNTEANNGFGAQRPASSGGGMVRRLIAARGRKRFGRS